MNEQECENAERSVESLAQQPVSWRVVSRLAWPIMVSMLSHTVMTVADTMWVGRLGMIPLAAVGFAGMMTFLIASFGMGLMNGVRVTVSQRVGAGDEESAARLAWQGVYLALTVGSLAVALFPFGPELMELTGATQAVQQQAVPYFGVRVLGSPVIFLLAGMSAFFQGRGDTRTPMIAALAANLGNVALDPLFIFGLGPWDGLGVAGAAWASNLCETMATAWLFWRFVRVVPSVPRRLSWPLLRELWRVGFPMGGRWALEVAAWVIFGSVLARVGDAELAAHVIVVRIISVSFMPGYAIGEAASVLAGQAVGAKRWEGVFEAHRVATALAVALMFLCGVAFVSIPGLLVLPFGAEGEVEALVRDLLLLAAAFQIFDAVAMVSQSTINGMGHTRFVAVTAVAVSWLVKLPLGWGLAIPMGMGALGAWLGLTAELVLIALISLAFLRYQRRKLGVGKAGRAEPPCPDGEPVESARPTLELAVVDARVT
ncbi:MAG: MATE family efflux transporter [Myxococcota bacterium]|nr:MATE family efflux transporter [Myxococcota bacterium]